MPTTKEMLEKILKDIKVTGGIEASAVVSRDGLLIASDIPQNVHAETFAAMTATMLGAAETAVEELNKGVVDRIIIEGKDVKIIGTGTGQKAILIVMTEPNTRLGLVLVEMDKAKEKIKGLL
jgi:uncharacterized protein